MRPSSTPRCGRPRAPGAPAGAITTRAAGRRRQRRGRARGAGHPGALRPRRHPGQQRRRQLSQALLEPDRQRHLQRGGGHQPERRDGLHAGGAAGHARAARGHGDQRRQLCRLALRLPHRPGLHRQQGRADGAEPCLQHRRRRQRPARHLAVPRRGGHADPAEAPGRAEHGRNGAHAAGSRTWAAPSASSPRCRRTCASTSW